MFKINCEWKYEGWVDNKKHWVFCIRRHPLALNFMFFFLHTSTTWKRNSHNLCPIHEITLKVNGSQLKIIFAIQYKPIYPSKEIPSRHHHCRSVHSPLPLLYVQLTNVWHEMDIWKSVYINCSSTLSHSITMWTEWMRVRKRTRKSYQPCWTIAAAILRHDHSKIC